jgi:hypothetical protein
MARTKQTCRKLAQSNPSLGKKKSPFKGPLPNAVPFNAKFRKAVERAETSGETMREAAAIRTLASLFDCSQLSDDSDEGSAIDLRDGQNVRRTIFPLDMQVSERRGRGERS